HELLGFVSLVQLQCRLEGSGRRIVPALCKLALSPCHGLGVRRPVGGFLNCFSCLRLCFLLAALRFYARLTSLELQPAQPFLLRLPAGGFLGCLGVCCVLGTSARPSQLAGR